MRKNTRKQANTVPITKQVIITQYNGYLQYLMHLVHSKILSKETLAQNKGFIKYKNEKSFALIFSPLHNHSIDNAAR